MLATVPLDNANLAIAPCRHGTFAFYQNDLIGRMLLTYGEWAEQEVAFLSSLVKPGDVVVDIGSHIGTISVPLARAVGLAGKVFCFEAQRLVFYNLCANVFLNGLDNVVAVHAAVSDHDGFLSLRERKQTEMKNSGGFRIPLGAKSPPSQDHTRMISLDRYFITDQSCRLIKMDIEGHEPAALEGMKSFVERTQPILYIESNTRERFERISSIVRGFHYKMFWHCEPHWNPNNFRGTSKNVYDDKTDLNLVCFPRAAVDIPETFVEACDFEQVSHFAAKE